MADHAQLTKVVEITALGTIAVTPALGGLFMLFSKVRNTMGRGQRRPQTDQELVSGPIRDYLKRPAYDTDYGARDPAYDPNQDDEDRGQQQPGAARTPAAAG